ncbi:uncharacterized protein [Hyperolius riggenbachi]|uniref:uncharacterized protein n=1 Tax=Hyperolius riggenbachi TaxID=752182 RepID=UPI0035A26DF4
MSRRRNKSTGVTVTAVKTPVQEIGVQSQKDEGTSPMSQDIYTEEDTVKEQILEDVTGTRKVKDEPQVPREESTTSSGAFGSLISVEKVEKVSIQTQTEIQLCESDVGFSTGSQDVEESKTEKGNLLNDLETNNQPSQASEVRTEKRRRKNRGRRSTRAHKKGHPKPGRDGEQKAPSSQLLTITFGKSLLSYASLGLVAFFFLIGGTQCSLVTPPSEPWQAYGFFTNDELCNVQLAVTKGKEPLCEIPASDCSEETKPCGDQSRTTIINSTCLLLLTKLKADMFFLENGHMKTITGINKGSFKDPNLAVQHFRPQSENQDRPTPSNLRLPTSPPPSPGEISKRPEDPSLGKDGVPIWGCALIGFFTFLIGIAATIGSQHFMKFLAERKRQSGPQSREAVPLSPAPEGP